MHQPLRLISRYGLAILCQLSFLFFASAVYAGGESTLAAENAVYESCGLNGKLNRDAFVKAYQKAAGLHQTNGKMVVIDFTLPSSQPRMFIIDLQSRKLLYTALVAHGKGSGDLMAVSFSNVPESHQSSVGMYRIGQKIVSPKHGDALLLEGLDKGLNDNARKREIILHAANYVSDAFIREHGRCGRSYGCPAVSPNDIGTIIQLLKDGGLLYIYAGPLA